MGNKRVSDEQFSRTKHRYTDPRTGERVVGVTTVVKCFDSGDKLGRGAAAAVKIERAGGDYRAEWDAKRDLGTRVHDYLHLWANGHQAEVRATDDAHADAFVAFCKDYRPEFVEVERSVVSSHGFGGRFDSIVWLPTLECFALVDYKTGKPYRAELTLQLAGYRYADGLLIYDDDGWAIDIAPMPHVDRAFGLYLSVDEETGKGVYDLVEVDADETAFEMFLHLLSVKQWSYQADKEKQPA